MKMYYIYTMGYYLLVKKSEITKSQINEYREKNLNEVTWQKKDK